jgi:tRNA 5-methylaminomethyl-2-thiouridine biosynthesis bifunctional protein
MGARVPCYLAELHENQHKRERQKVAYFKMRDHTYDAVVIGGGIAGASTAYALARRSLKVFLCEAQPTLAAKGSGNARGLIMPYVATHNSPPGRLYARGFSFTRHLLTETLSPHNIYTECGAIQLPATKRLARILIEPTPLAGESPISRVSAQEGSEISGALLSSGAFWIPQGGFCAPAHFTRTLVHEAGERITTECEREASDLSYDNGVWRVQFTSGEGISAPTVALCGAHEISRLPTSSWVPLEPIRGQTALTLPSATSGNLKSVISYDGYITPASDGAHFVGAHYRHDDLSEEANSGDTEEVLSRLYRALPSIRSLTVASARVCFRASTHDRLPYIGHLPKGPGENTPHVGLFINAGHGSRGLLTAPIGGEIIARLVTNTPLEDLSEAAQISSANRIPPR